MAKGPLSLVGVVTLLIVVARQSLSGEAVRPRGVRPDLATFYDPSRDFQCLDGSTTITFEQVNDDYCDCRDGSDEPGTSACPNANFYCPNRGFKPSLVSHQQPEELELIIVGIRAPLLRAQAQTLSISRSESWRVSASTVSPRCVALKIGS